MVDNSTKINKTNSHISSQTNIHKKTMQLANIFLRRAPLVEQVLPPFRSTWAIRVLVGFVLLDL